MEMPHMLDGFLVSTAAGAGQGLGQILMTWFLQRWRTMTGAAPPVKTMDAAPRVPLGVSVAAGDALASLALAGDASANAALAANAPAEAASAFGFAGATASPVALAASSAPGNANQEAAGSDGSASASTPSPPPELVRAVESPRSASDWAEVLRQLEQFGVELPRSAAVELAGMQQAVLDRVAAPTMVLGRLAEMTSQAVARAGIAPADLRRWQRIEDCLADEPDLESLSHASAHDASGEVASVSSSVPVGVARLARPSTWFAWTREELDRRLTTYLRRTVRRCDQACEQALRTLVDCEVSALRELRNWRTDLSLLEQFLASLPPLNVKTRSLRPLSGRGKEATRALEEAALVATSLLDATTRLFQQSVGSNSWNQNLLACRQATAQLTQHVRERRELR